MRGANREGKQRHRVSYISTYSSVHTDYCAAPDDQGVISRFMAPDNGTVTHVRVVIEKFAAKNLRLQLEIQGGGLPRVQIIPVNHQAVHDGRALAVNAGDRIVARLTGGEAPDQRTALEIGNVWFGLEYSKTTRTKDNA